MIKGSRVGAAIVNRTLRHLYQFIVAATAVHLLIAGALASELKGVSPDGQLIFECVREEKPGAESHLYLWEKSKPENRKLVFTIAHPLTEVKISPDGTWIAFEVILPKLGPDLALLRRIGKLEYQRVKGTEQLVTIALQDACQRDYHTYFNPYAVSADAHLIMEWSPDSRKLGIILHGKFLWGTVSVENKTSLYWRGELTVETMRLTPDMPEPQKSP
jgi:hypothetical protein